MVGLERERALQIVRPFPSQGGGQPEDEIERQIRDPGVAKGVDGGADLLGGVGPVHPREHRRVERLRAERDPVDPGGAPGRGRVRRVTSSGLASSVISASGAIGRSDATRSRIRAIAAGIEPRRRSAAEVDRVHRGRTRPRSRGLPARPLAKHRIGVGVRRHVAAHRDGEVAVAAAPGAEGDVDVEVHVRNLLYRRASGSRVTPRHEARADVGQASEPQSRVTRALGRSLPRMHRSLLDTLRNILPGHLLHHAGDLQRAQLRQQLLRPPARRARRAHRAGPVGARATRRRPARSSPSPSGSAVGGRSGVPPATRHGPVRLGIVLQQVLRLEQRRGAVADEPVGADRRSDW